MKRLSSRYIRLIATGLSFLGILFFGKPLVEDYFGNRASLQEVESLREELAILQEQELLLAESAKRVETTVNEFISRATLQDNHSQVRDQFVELVRAVGCQIRHVETSETVVRPWQGEQDNLNGETVSNTLEPTSLDLHVSRLGLTITGNLTSVKNLLKELTKRRFLSVLEYASVQPSDTTGSSVQMELKLKLLGLQVRDAQPEGSDFDESLVVGP